MINHGSKNVAIIHPWFPQYRAEFFRRAQQEAAESGIRLQIFHGAPPREWRDRSDSVADDHIVELPTREIPLGSRTLTAKSLKGFFQAGPYDLVILEQAVRNLESYRLLTSRFSGKLAFWGHGKTYTQPVGRLQETFKQILTRRGQWFFAYTDGGARAVVQAGFPADRVTVVQNSIDTRSLEHLMDSTTANDVEAIQERLDLHGRTALFLGGLDPSKRLEFLLDAAEECASRDPDFRLVFAGAGSQSDIIEAAAASRNYVINYGPARGREKAELLKACQVIAMPGRVGLVAVDSFAAGRPIVTTDWPYHAPEFEYLADGLDSLISHDSVPAYASALSQVLSNSEMLDTLTEGCLKKRHAYTVEQMTHNFVGGLALALERISEAR